MNKQQQINELKEKISELEQAIIRVKESIGYEPVSSWYSGRRLCRIDHIEDYLRIRWSEETVKGYKKIKK
jgi:hypothetical protein